MSLLRNVLLFGMVIISVSTLIALLVCWLIDKPLHLDECKTKLEKLENKYLKDEQ